MSRSTAPSEAVIHHPAVPLDEKRLWYLFLFCVSTGMMVLTKSAVLVATWVFIWFFAKHYATSTKHSEFLSFWLAFVLFYPSVSTVFSDLQELDAIRAEILMVFLVTCVGAISHGFRCSRLLSLVLICWFGWGILAYLPVFLTWLAKSVLKMSLPGLFPFILYYETSALKLAMSIILSAMAALVPIVSLKQRVDFRKFYEAVTVGVIILCLLSLLQVLLGTRFIPTDYPELPDRYAGFSIPDTNNHGRLLLMPSLLLLSLIMGEGKRIRLLALVAVFLCILSIILTVSRTTYGSFTTGFLVLFLLNFRRSRNFFTVCAVGIISASMLLVTGTLEMFAAPDSERRSLDHLDGRLELYATTVELLFINPWFGTFPGGYHEGLKAVGFVGVLQSAHNMLLHVAAEWGIPMAVVLLTALFSATYYGFKGARQFDVTDQTGKIPEVLAMAKAMVALSIAYLVQGLTQIVPPDYVFLALGMAIASWSFARQARVQVPVSVA